MDYFLEWARKMNHLSDECIYDRVFGSLLSFYNIIFIQEGFMNQITEKEREFIENKT